jgi:hypothetical protein
MKKIALLLLLVSNISFSQTPQELEAFGRLLNDAIFYCDKYITPVSDAAIYQASSGWVTSPKKRKLWEVTLGFNNNVFFVPKADREFEIKNSDFTFFSIYTEPDWTPVSSATVPTALGTNQQYNLNGYIGNDQVFFQTPQGVNAEQVYYSHFTGSVAIWYGTELILKYSPVTKLKSGNYQVYGYGLKHNIDQYFNLLLKNKINMSGLVCFSNENISFGFITPSLSNGPDLGIDEINGLVDTWQFQYNVSKEFKRFEIMAGIIANVSDIKYKFIGDVPPGQAIPFQSVFNEKIKEIYKTKTNYLGEVSCRYKINKVFLQSTFAFGKFVNSNFAVQYEF